MKFRQLWHVFWDTLLCFILPLPLSNVHMPFCDRFRLRMSRQHLHLFASFFFFFVNVQCPFGFVSFSLPFKVGGISSIDTFYLYLSFLHFMFLSSSKDPPSSFSSSAKKFFQLKNQFRLQSSEEIKSYRVQSILSMSICIQQIMYELWCGSKNEKR